MALLDEEKKTTQKTEEKKLRMYTGLELGLFRRRAIADTARPLRSTSFVQVQTIDNVMRSYRTIGPCAETMKCRYPSPWSKAHFEKRGKERKSRKAEIAAHTVVL